MELLLRYLCLLGFSFAGALPSSSRDFFAKIGGEDFICRPIRNGREKRCCLLRTPHRTPDKRCVDILHIPVHVPVPIPFHRGGRPNLSSSSRFSRAGLRHGSGSGKPFLPSLGAKVAAPKRSSLAAQERSFSGINAPSPPPPRAYRNGQSPPFSRASPFSQAAFHPSQVRPRGSSLPPSSVLDVFGHRRPRPNPKVHPASTFSQRPLPHVPKQVGFVPPPEALGPLDEASGPLGFLQNFELAESGSGGIFTNAQPIPSSTPPKSFPPNPLLQGFSKISARGGGGQLIQPSPAASQFLAPPNRAQTQPRPHPLSIAAPTQARGKGKGTFRLFNPSPGSILGSLNQGPKPPRPKILRPPQPRITPRPEPKTRKPVLPSPRPSPQSFRPNAAQLAKLHSAIQPLGFQGRPGQSLPSRLRPASSSPQSSSQPQHSVSSSGRDAFKRLTPPQLETGKKSLEDKLGDRAPSVFHRTRTAAKAPKAATAKPRSQSQPERAETRPHPRRPRPTLSSTRPPPPPRHSLPQRQTGRRGSSESASRERVAEATVGGSGSGAEGRTFKPWPPLEGTLLPGRIPCRRPWGCRPDRLVTARPLDQRRRNTPATPALPTNAGLNQPAEKPSTRTTTRLPRTRRPNHLRRERTRRPQRQPRPNSPQQRRSDGNRRPHPRPRPTTRPQPPPRRRPQSPRRQTEALAQRTQTENGHGGGAEKRILPAKEISFPRAPADTKCFIDLALVIDASGSLQEAWEEQLRLASDIVQRLELGERKAKVSLIKFAGPNKARVIHSFADAQNKAEILGRLGRLRHSSGITETAEALRLTAAEFSPGSGSRIGEVKPVAIVFTDGFSATDPMAAAESLIDKGVLVYSIAVNDGPRDEFELATIAGHPARVFHRASFAQFRRRFDNLTSDCASPFRRL